MKYKEFLNLAYHVPLCGEKPPCAMLVGHPGTGKSHLLLHYRGSNCMYLSDTTAAGIETVMEQFDKNPKFHYIVCPDIITVLTRRSKRFISFLNIALEEGVKAVLRKDIVWKTRNGGAHIGLITAITTPEFKANYWLLQSTGFLSRTFFLDFDPDTAESARNIARGVKDQGVEITVPMDKLYDVGISEEAALETENLGKAWAKSEGERPLRRTLLLRRFSRAQALVQHLEGKRDPLITTAEDVSHVWKLFSQIRFDPRSIGKTSGSTGELFGGGDRQVRRVNADYSKWTRKTDRSNAG